MIKLFSVGRGSLENIIFKDTQMGPHRGAFHWLPPRGIKSKDLKLGTRWGPQGWSPLGDNVFEGSKGPPLGGVFEIKKTEMG